MAQLVGVSNLNSIYKGGGRLYSVQATVPLRNGYIGVVGDLVAGEREIRKFSAVTDITKGHVLGLVVSGGDLNDLNYVLKKTVDNEIPANTPVRAYTFNMEGEFDISIDGISAIKDNLPEKDHYVTLENNSFVLKEKANLDGTEKFACKIEYVFDKGINATLSSATHISHYKMAHLRVVVNELTD